jgi:hypothetical protein
MPQVIPIIIAAVSAAGLGTSIYQQVSAPGAPKAPTAAQLASQNQLNPAQLANAVRSAKGDTQSATSGGVSPDYLSQLIQGQYGINAGNPGVVNQQSALQWGGGTSFGTPSTSGGSLSSAPFGNASSAGSSNTGLATPTAGGFNISDWLKQLQEGATA